MRKQSILTVLGILLFVGSSVVAQEVSQDAQVEGPTDPGTRTITLAEAQKLALATYPSMKNMDEQIVQASMAVRKAWAILLPNLSASAQIIRNQREIALDMPDLSGAVNAAGAPVMDRIVMQEEWGKSFGFSANMPLFNARAFPAIKIAEEYKDSIRKTSKHRKNELLFLVTSSFYQVQSSARLIEVQGEVLNNAENFLKQSQSLVRVGQGTELDVLRAEIQVMDVEKELQNARDTHAMAKMALSYLIGVDGSFEVAEVAMPRPELEEKSKIVEGALEGREDLKAADISISIAERDKQATYLKWVPVFDVTFNWNWTSAAGFSGENASWMLIFGARWNILEGGARFAELKEKESKIRVAHNNRQQLELDVRSQIDRALLDLEKRARNIEFAVKQVELSERNYHLVSRQYQVGIATSLDVLTATTDLNNKRTGEVLEELQYQIAALTLRKAAGDYSELLSN